MKEKTVRMLIKSTSVIRFIGLMFVVFTVWWIMNALGFDVSTTCVFCLLLMIGLMLLSIADFLDALDLIMDIAEEIMEEL
uniref:Uncharacterized protein n=1 Tax=viral metagenome TaxID=1070528 RepID=A0A6M3LWF3_9ZZZZ